MILFKREKRKIFIMKICYRLVCMLGFDHAKYLRKKNLFRLFGQNVLYQTHFLPNNPQRVKIHDNVKIAANVVFYEHDVINAVFECLDSSAKMHGHGTCIEICENVFIGGNTVIIGNVCIGPNAIVAGGSVVAKDVPPGTIVGGNPAKVIGNFYELLKKRQQEDVLKDGYDSVKIVDEDWAKFDEKRQRNK